MLSLNIAQLLGTYGLSISNEKEVMLKNVQHTTGAARIAAATLGGDISLLDGSKALAEALQNLLTASGDAAESSSLENKMHLLDATVAFREAAAALNATSTERLIDDRKCCSSSVLHPHVLIPHLCCSQLLVIVYWSLQRL